MQKLTYILDKKNVKMPYQISPEICDSPPHAGKSEPADKEAEGEDEQDVPPLDVEHGVEEVGDVPSTTLRYVRSLDTDHAFIR